MRAPSNWLIAVNNVNYDNRLCDSHDSLQYFHILLILPLDPMLESGGGHAADSVNNASSAIKEFQCSPAFTTDSVII